MHVQVLLKNGSLHEEKKIFEKRYVLQLKSTDATR